MKEITHANRLEQKMRFKTLYHGQSKKRQSAMQPTTIVCLSVDMISFYQLCPFNAANFQLLIMSINLLTQLHYKPKLNQVRLNKSFCTILLYPDPYSRLHTDSNTLCYIQQYSMLIYKYRQDPPPLSLSNFQFSNPLISMQHLQLGQLYQVIHKLLETWPTIRFSLSIFYPPAVQIEFDLPACGLKNSTICVWFMGLMYSNCNKVVIVFSRLSFQGTQFKRVNFN